MNKFLFDVILKPFDHVPIIYLGLGIQSDSANALKTGPFYPDYGLDRIVAILANETSIREVIAFPKTATATDMMSSAPSSVDPRQLRELHLEIRK